MTGWVSALLIAIPSVGAALGFAFWSRVQGLRMLALLVSCAGLLLVAALSQHLAGLIGGMALLALLPVVAFLSLLGQPSHQDNRLAWITTLLLLGLGLGVMTSGAGVGTVLLAVILIIVGILIHRYRVMSVYHPWQGIAMGGFGVLCLLVSLISAPPVSAFASLAACAVLLPLVPFHAGYVAALAGLPGNLPSFLAFLLPVLGFHRLLTLRPHLPGMAVDTVLILGVAGALYGALRALAQSRVRPLLAYANLSFFSMLWWYVAVSQSIPPQATVYLSSVGLATSGLLLAWYAIAARYGDMDLLAIRGLSHAMPRFAVLFALLALAALGLPPFGVFSGFMGMLLAPSLRLSWALLGIAIAWLTASWYFLDVAQRLLFGRHRPDLRYEDLRKVEMVSLLMIVLLLAALGVVPSRVFEAGAPILKISVAAEVGSWSH